MNIRRIAIVGGGTAGWLAANYLGEALSAASDVSITLIESPDVPAIGVGEGTVPAMRQTLKRFGIRETDFFRECDATFKQGIKFVNWLDKNRQGPGNYYYHLFDYPFPFGDDLTPYWLSQRPQIHYADTVSVQAGLCESGRAPKRISTPEYQGDATYAYHLNAAKFARLLARNATEKFSVTHTLATVMEAQTGTDGFLTGLITEEYGLLEFDFYVDASGFSSILLGNTLNVPFVDKSRELFVDSALVIQVPTQDSAEIPPYTLATAHQAGWIWDIALPERRGVGFVYSSSHMESAEAERKFSRYLNLGGEEKSFRKISMKVGHRAAFWSKNCVAVGLAQGFIEPLEATSILLADFGAKLLAEQFPSAKGDIELLETKYNKTLVYSWERVFDFIKLHYCLSDRCDSPFWVDNRNPETLSQHLHRRLNQWQRFSPKHQDFFSKFEIFDIENYLYVMYGMQFHTQAPPLPEHYTDKAKHQVEAVQRQAQRLLKELPEHRDLINRIKKYGLQSI